MSRLVVLMGAPGAGKSTWAAQQSLPVVSLDAMRDGGVFDSYLYGEAMVDLAAYLAQGRGVVFDSTAAKPSVRAVLLAMAGYTEASTRLVYFDTPLALCLARNEQRQYPVPDDTLTSLWHAIKEQRAVVELEGWEQVIVMHGGEQAEPARGQVHDGETEVRLA